MKTIKVTLFVGNASRAAHRIERTAYGYMNNKNRWVEGKVDEEDFDAVDLINEAINILYSCRGEEVTIELPAVLRVVAKRKEQYEEAAEEDAGDDGVIL